MKARVAKTLSIPLGEGNTLTLVQGEFVSVTKRGLTILLGNHTGRLLAHITAVQVQQITGKTMKKLLEEHHVALAQE